LAYIANVQRHCGLLVRLCNVQVRVKGSPVAGTNFLYVGNHMGFVDIFVVSALVPALFITSQEMRETPVLGDLCEMAGCIFVERRSRTKIMGELNVLVDALKQGFNIVLYPEATSSNGEKILPFKKTLMMSGPHAGKPIQPACINYLEVNGEEFSLKWRDHVCWYGDMPFTTAMWNMLTTKSVTAELEFLEPIYANAETNRSEVANQAFHSINSRFRPVVTRPEAVDVGVAEES